MNIRPEQRFWAGLTLRECLVACFCSALALASSMFLRIPMRLPGHRVLPLVFFLLVGRYAVGRAWAGTAIGLLTAVMSFSVGWQGLDHAMKYLAAGLITDAVAMALPRLPRSIPFCVIAGGLIGASWLPVSLLINRLAGMDLGVALGASLIKVGSGIFFGAVGAAPVPTVLRRLGASGLLPSSAARQIAPPLSVEPRQLQ